MLQPPSHSRHGSLVAKVSQAGIEHGFLLLTALASILPLYMMVTASLETPETFRGESFLPPPTPTLENYSTALTSLGFLDMTRNTAILSVVGSVLSVACAALAAFGLLHVRRPRPALGFVLSLMAVPPVVVIVPLFLTMSSIGWINHYGSAIVIEAGILVPFNTFLVFTHMRRLPEEVFEAAAIDGASQAQLFGRIVLPLSKPAIVTAMLVSVVVIWNDLLIPLIFWPSSDLRTLMVGLALLGPGRSGLRDVPLLMAGVGISIVPLIILFVLARRRLISGLTEGAVK